ncbi:excinuclease ABC subunit UvrC [Desulfobacterota bacterium AH_259_B03_O07]|nr:excinuclease ABC subunit UvrC [Desulfobacterota bacterium AH_259_B03_O07]
MKDEKGRPIYIGKAKNLKNRVRSYYQGSGTRNRPQVPYIIQHVNDLDYIVTQNDREALLIENSLIKKHKPKFNIQLKDDKNYASLRLDINDKFPRLTYTRKVLNDGALYFGPFASGDALRKTKRLIHRIFPLRDCTDAKFKRHSHRPCLNYFMKLCTGPCAGRVSEAKYGEVVEHAKMFLKGKITEMLKLLKESMSKASEELRFEDAAHYRDQIYFLEKHPDVQGLISSTQTDMDVVGYYRESRSVDFVVLFSRGGNIIDKSEFNFNNASWEDNEVLREFLTQFYGVDRFIPKDILIPVGFEGLNIFSDWLSEKRGKKMNIMVPKQGARLKFIELARRNAEESFKRRFAQKQKELLLIQSLKNALFLKRVPEKIECFDISNIQGDLAVASMVKFQNGSPDKKRYKRFKIKTVIGANDYAMMYEVLLRRFKRADQEKWELPDLILVDGGKGQLNIAQEVLSEIGFLAKVDLASIAKGREEGETDKIYVPGRKNPIPLSKKSGELLFLMRIRDEAHRFAISYHRRLRTKKGLQSALDSIPGIGKKRKFLLLKHIGSISNIRNASVEELLSIPGIDINIAQVLKQYFNN